MSSRWPSQWLGVQSERDIVEITEIYPGAFWGHVVGRSGTWKYYGIVGDMGWRPLTPAAREALAITRDWHASRDLARCPVSREWLSMAGTKGVRSK